MKIGVIVNEGKHLGGGPEQLRSVLGELGDHDPVWRTTGSSNEAPAAVTELVGLGVDRLLVWGGDGTVSHSIDAALGCDPIPVIGVIPAGTGNVLARNLGIPIDLRAAAEIAVGNTTVAIDIGRITTGSGSETLFCEIAGTGLDALIMRSSGHHRKRLLGRFGYVWSGLGNVRRPPFVARVELDGSPWFHGEATAVTIANVADIFGGLPAFPDAAPDDATLHVGIAWAASVTSWVRLLTRTIVDGQPDASPLAATSQANEVSILLDRPMPWQTDGEDHEPEHRLHIRCEPATIAIATASVSTTSAAEQNQEPSS